MTKQQTYEDAVLKCAMWWSDKSFRARANQNNGDDSSTGALAHAMWNTNSILAQQQATPDKIRAFETKLTELLLKTTAPWERTLNVDYGPGVLLYDAAVFAGIDLRCLPIKSHTRIDSSNRAFAKYQYGGDEIEI